MNLMIYSFITSKGSSHFDTTSTIKSLAKILEDKHIKVRFIAMEGLTYLTTLEDSNKIIILGEEFEF